MERTNKPSPFVTKKMRKYVKNAFNTFSSITPLRQVLFSKINRHEPQVPVTPVKKKDDFSDARHYEHFVPHHSSHFSSKNFI